MTRDFSRRDFLKIAGYSLAGLLGYNFLNSETAEASIPNNSLISTPSQLVRFGPLAGRRLGDLYPLYLGLSQERNNSGVLIPEQARVNYARQLQRMWAIKERRSKRNPVVRQLGDDVVNSFARRQTRIGLEDYIDEAQNSVNEVRTNINWNSVRELYRLNDRQLRTLQNVSNIIGGNGVLAYALTELMPSSDGDLNVLVMDHLLRTAGREYVENIPALSDRFFSFGPFQFTSYALNARDSTAGATRMNTALPRSHQIPGSVSMLRGNDHFSAAYLFMLHNSAELINNLSDRQISRLGNVRERRDNFLAYLAAAHHAPALARRDARQWIDGNPNAPIANYADGRIHRYINKTLANLRALRRY